jgi:hypothetical protein
MLYPVSLKSRDGDIVCFVQYRPDFPLAMCGVLKIAVYEVVYSHSERLEPFFI